MRSQTQQITPTSKLIFPVWYIFWVSFAVFRFWKLIILCSIDEWTRVKIIIVSIQFRDIWSQSADLVKGFCYGSSKKTPLSAASHFIRTWHILTFGFLTNRWRFVFSKRLVLPNKSKLIGSLLYFAVTSLPKVNKICAESRHCASRLVQAGGNFCVLGPIHWEFEKFDNSKPSQRYDSRAEMSSPSAGKRRMDTDVIKLYVHPIRKQNKKKEKKHDQDFLLTWFHWCFLCIISGLKASMKWRFSEGWTSLLWNSTDHEEVGYYRLN